MFDFITTKLLMWICAGLAAALLVAGGVASCEHHNANEARADRDAMESERDSVRAQRDGVVKANQTQQNVIASQAAALTKWAAIGVSPEEVKEVLAAEAAKRSELEQFVADNQNRKEKDDAKPECEKLRRTDFQRVCPERADILRGYETRLSRRRDPR